MSEIYFTLEQVKVLLKKQRELCSHALECDVPKSAVHNLVLNAPEPILIPTPPSLIKFI